MREVQSLPFSDVMSGLFTGEHVPVHLLFRLSDMRPWEQERLFAAWPDVEAERRREIMRHLVDFAEENFVVDFTPMFKMGLDDPSTAVRIAALDGLWDATDVRLIPPVLRIMQNDPDAEARAAAASALAHFVLLAEWGQVPQRSVVPVIEALLRAYENPATAVPVKRSALEALGSANHPRVNTLIEEAYENEDLDMQLSAIFAMGNTADPRWLPIILAELNNPSPAMRAEAAHAAGALGRGDAIALLAELTQDEEDEVREAAVVGLGQIGGDRVQTILTDLLNDPEFEALHEVIQEALDSMLLLAGELSLMKYQEDDFDDDDLDDDFAGGDFEDDDFEDDDFEDDDFEDDDFEDDDFEDDDFEGDNFDDDFDDIDK
jgi:HEAT repeat protein